MKKLILILILLTSFCDANEDIPHIFETTFAERYLAFAQETGPIRDFLGDEANVLRECWLRYEEDDSISLAYLIDTIIDDYLNEKIESEIYEIAAEITLYFGIDLTQEGWPHNMTWEETKEELRQTHRRDLELNDNPDLRGDLADYCELLERSLNLGQNTPTGLPEVAAFLRRIDLEEHED